MLSSSLRETAERILPLATAPLHETHVAREVTAILNELPHVTYRRDSFGNIHAAYSHRKPPKRPSAFTMVAHLDHPGFELRHDNKPCRAKFLGGIADAYFEESRIEFFNEETVDPLGEATITRLNDKETHKTVVLDQAPPRDATFAMWKLPAKPRFSQTSVRARVCDDLAQVVTMLEVFRRLSEANARTEVHALFTRAEEIGLMGALVALTSQPEPFAMDVPILSLEVSLARGFAEMGGGPVLRVGDRRSIFTPDVTAWLENAFHLKQVQAPDEEIDFQRCLMGGGTCEATVFAQVGLPTGALCLPMRNYHNMGPSNRLAPEVIHPRDWKLLVDYLVFLATEAPVYTPVREAQLQPRLARLQKEGAKLLRSKSLKC